MPDVCLVFKDPLMVRCQGFIGRATQEYQANGIQIVTLRNANIDNCNIRKPLWGKALANNYELCCIIQRNQGRTNGSPIMKRLALQAVMTIWENWYAICSLSLQQ